LVDEGGNQACDYPRGINMHCLRPPVTGIFIPVLSERCRWC
jgi:hypothetical protein